MLNCIHANGLLLTLNLNVAANWTGAAAPTNSYIVLSLRGAQAHEEEGVSG